MLLTLIRQGGFVGLVPGHALLDQEIFSGNRFSFFDIVNSRETLLTFVSLVVVTYTPGGVCG